MYKYYITNRYETVEKMQNNTYMYIGDGFIFGERFRDFAEVSHVDAASVHGFCESGAIYWWRRVVQTVIYLPQQGEIISKDRKDVIS